MFSFLFLQKVIILPSFFVDRLPPLLLLLLLLLLIFLQESLLEERRMQLEYSAKMDADEEKKRAELRKVQDRQVKNQNKKGGEGARGFVDQRRSRATRQYYYGGP